MAVDPAHPTAPASVRPRPGPGRLALVGALVLGLGLPACRPDEEPGAVPTADEVEEAYQYRGRLEATIRGSVAEIRASQERSQLERGGPLWAKVGPYILLFSDETRGLFRSYPGLEAVRVITETPDGEEVARAYLHRRAQNELTWQRALNIAGRVRRHGTDRPGLLTDLVRWGEEHTDFEYAPAFQRM